MVTFSITPPACSTLNIADRRDIISGFTTSFSISSGWLLVAVRTSISHPVKLTNQRYTDYIWHAVTKIWEAFGKLEQLENSQKRK
jgi:hypothetical protein